MKSENAASRPTKELTDDLNALLVKMDGISRSYNHQVIPLARQCCDLVDAIATKGDPQALPALGKALEISVNRRGLDHFTSYERYPDDCKDKLDWLIDATIKALSGIGVGASVPLLSAFAVAAPRNAVPGSASSFYPLPRYYHSLLITMENMPECIPGLFQLTKNKATASAAVEALTRILRRKPEAVDSKQLSDIAGLTDVIQRMVPPDPEWGSPFDKSVDLSRLRSLALQEIEKRRRAPIIARRKSRRLCILCGRSLGWLDRLTGQDHHRTCTVFEVTQLGSE